MGSFLLVLTSYEVNVHVHDAYKKKKGEGCFLGRACPQRDELSPLGQSGQHQQR